MQDDKILVFGRGYMAKWITKHFSECAVNDPADITEMRDIDAAIRKHKPTIVVNAAGKTIIDQIEKPENRPHAYMVNVRGVANLAYQARVHGLYCVQLSSGCIFDGTGEKGEGFREDDVPNPGCYYGWTKAWSDWQLYPFLHVHNILVLRLRMPLSRVSNPRNLLNKLQVYDKVINEQNSITVVEDFLSAMEQLIDQRATGTYHVTNPGTISPYEITQLMQKSGLIPADKEITPISKAQLDELTDGFGGARRVNTILNTDKLQSTGVILPDIRVAVQEAIDNFTEES